ncbi:MAG: hypothetical protein V3T86_06185 [Planctomycetota bacterium]
MKKMWKSIRLGAFALAVTLLGFNAEAEARGGRGGGGGRGGSGRGGGAGRGAGGRGGGGTGGSANAKDAQSRERQEERMRRVAGARLEYARRERQQLWDAEAKSRFQKTLDRIINSNVE